MGLGKLEKVPQAADKLGMKSITRKQIAIGDLNVW